MARVRYHPHNRYVLEFRCPGCGRLHIVPFHSESGYDVLWEFNGDLERPTITPSIKNSDQRSVCHCYITDGMIRFDNDSTHSLAGQMVELPENY